MSVKLDMKDKQILMLLDTDATLSYTAIAKKIRLSKEAVAYRVKQLEKKGIIVDYITLSHFAKTGLIHFKLYMQYTQIGKQEREEIISYLRTFTNIGWLASTEGSYDLMLSIRYETVHEFEAFKDEFFKRYDKYFRDVQFAILTEAETKPRMYVLPEKAKHKLFMHCDAAQKEPMDKHDRSILNALSTNARAPYYELAKKTGLTERIIRYRRKEMERRGIIVGYKLAIDYRKLNYLFFKCFLSFRNMTDEAAQKLREYLRQHPNVIYWIKTIGPWDLEPEIEAPSVERFYEIVQELKDEFSDIVVRVDSTLVAKEHRIAHA
ncbi:MAG: Lrp/AsnC family transcriptional regulator [Candidatus Woesearchaeota archaeon]|nr:Lrp/AsnC family transcriptional regulator [Candidatus Woesearchaeota archaeon]